LGRSGYTITVGNQDGCEATLPITPEDVPGFSATVFEAVQPTCEEATGTITVTSVTTDLEYSIDGTTFAPYPANGWTGLAPGDYTITVRNEDGCEASADITIEEVPGLPVIEVEAVQPTCEEATGTITVTDVTSDLEYSIDGTTFAPYPANGWTGLAPGDYTITVRNEDGCEASADITIEDVPGLPVIEVEAVQPTCEEATGTITVTDA